MLSGAFSPPCPGRNHARGKSPHDYEFATRVSRHCGDPAVRSVVDVGWSSFNGTTGGHGRFRTSAEPRVNTFLDEPNNSCYHLELAR